MCGGRGGRVWGGGTGKCVGGDKLWGKCGKVCWSVGEGCGKVCWDVGEVWESLLGCGEGKGEMCGKVF